MLTFDHIAIATTDLAEGTAEVEEWLGVELHKGGKHEHFGTHNSLLNLGDLYLEVIAKDPDANVTRPTWFGLDAFAGPTRPANWICRTPDFANLPSEVGAPVALERDGLRWQLTVPDDGSLPWGGAHPSLLKWGEGIVPPSGSLPDQGCRLVSWTVIHPQIDAIRKLFQLPDDRVHYEVGSAPAFRAILATPLGEVTLA